MSDKNCDSVTFRVLHLHLVVVMVGRLYFGNLLCSSEVARRNAILHITLGLKSIINQHFQELRYLRFYLFVMIFGESLILDSSILQQRTKAHTLYHGLDCRKISGSDFSNP